MIQSIGHLNFWSPAIRVKQFHWAYKCSIGSSQRRWSFPASNEIRFAHFWLTLFSKNDRSHLIYSNLPSLNVNTANSNLQTWSKWNGKRAKIAMNEHISSLYLLRSNWMSNYRHHLVLRVWSRSHEYRKYTFTQAQFFYIVFYLSVSFCFVLFFVALVNELKI